mmetsp:Transcript_132042/g.263507  ORF Transcript_132042/g.263507 Transcript_132042/m.263507 type:complete len:321 (-) Transcript_132042:309-1271(-)
MRQQQAASRKEGPAKEPPDASFTLGHPNTCSELAGTIPLASGSLQGFFLAESDAFEAAASLPEIAAIRKFVYPQEEVTMPDSPGSVATLFGCQYSPFCKCYSRCTNWNYLILTIGQGVGVLGNLFAHIEFRSVLMDQTMRMKFVAVLVAANLDPNVATIHAGPTIHRRDFIQQQRNAFESAFPKMAAFCEFAHGQSLQWVVIPSNIARTHFDVHARPNDFWVGNGTSDLPRQVVPVGVCHLALVEKCCVLLHHPMGMELVAINVTADPDEKARRLGIVAHVYAKVPLRVVAHIRAIGRFCKPDCHDAVDTISLGQRLRRR